MSTKSNPATSRQAPGSNSSEGESATGRGYVRSLPGTAPAVGTGRVTPIGLIVRAVLPGLSSGFPPDDQLCAEWADRADRAGSGLATVAGCGVGGDGVGVEGAFGEAAGDLDEAGVVGSGVAAHRFERLVHRLLGVVGQ